MQKISIDALARQQLEAATAVSSGRASDTVFGGHEKRLRQTVMAFRAGTQLSEHQNPGEATVYVIKGSVWLKSGGEAWQGKAGDLLIVPDGLHSLEAEEDSAVLFTVVKTDR
ncbi:cupin domain-containing protein [Arthrobacter nitrophenolicus]|jgi:quercetin dioxygenase-like cupin family protein|uniref:Cupin domain-containing protein n=2 Tax=Arthrobacter nitrophenolicus TaxID=683150 RepID=L8TJT7_9MICC|nr:cupin domain-containing protein [Arthrobacter nitrophenolicus]ELT43558.1 cupin domain-containing protein [Arthrobacter nitrophenolicus]TDL32318.1 cupin domain-containing protein [Arthrobacter nitrophenolicus]